MTTKENTLGRVVTETEADTRHWMRNHRIEAAIDLGVPLHVECRQVDRHGQSGYGACLCAPLDFADGSPEREFGAIGPLLVIERTWSNAAAIARSQAIDYARSVGLPFVE